MANPDITENFKDGSLSGAGLGTRRQIKVGVCANGPTNVRTSCGTLAAMLAIFGGGPTVEAAALQGQESGYPVDVVRVPSTVAGILGALFTWGSGSPATAVTLAGTSTAVPTFTGSAGNVALALKVTSAGTLTVASGTAAFAYSLDGGLTWSAPITVTGVAAVLPLGASGLSVAWAAGNLIHGDAWAGSSVQGAQVGTATVVVSGSPGDAFHVMLRITRDGTNLAAATAAYVLSLDGGITWSAETAMPVGGVVSPAQTGITLTFSNGAGTAFRARDVFEFYTTAPGYTLSDLQAAVTSLNPSADDWEFVHVVGAMSGSSAAAVQTLMATFEGAHRFVWAFVETRDQAPEEDEPTWETAVKADFAALWGTAPRVSVAAGYAQIISPITLRTVRRPGAWAVAARLGTLRPGQDVAEVGDGAFTKIQVPALFFDSVASPGMHDAGFTVLRTLVGAAGVFVCDGFTAAGNGSDFYYLVGRRVIDAAARAARAIVLPKLSSSVRVNPDTVSVPYVPGAIYEPDARAIDSRATTAVRAAVVATGDATDARVKIDRSVVLTVVPPPTIPVQVSVLPLGYLRSIALNIQFQNPNG